MFGNADVDRMREAGEMRAGLDRAERIGHRLGRRRLMLTLVKLPLEPPTIRLGPDRPRLDVAAHGDARKRGFPVGRAEHGLKVHDRGQNLSLGDGHAERLRSATDAITSASSAKSSSFQSSRSRSAVRASKSHPFGVSVADVRTLITVFHPPRTAS